VAARAEGRATRTVSAGAIVVLALGALDFGLEGSLIIPALPRFAELYHASVTGVAWLATGFLISGVVAVPLFGRLADLYGKRRLLLVALAAFCVGSLVCALAHSIELAIAGRIVQGLGTAVGPLTFGLTRDVLPADMLPRAVGLIIGAASIGAAVGLVFSGILADSFSPATIFWCLTVFSGLLAAAVVVLVPETPVRADVRVDAAGAALLIAALFTFILAVSQGNKWHWSSPSVIALFAGSGALFGTFALAERRSREPLVDMRLVVRRPFAGANLCAFVIGYSFYLATFVIPLLAAAPPESGYGQGRSTTEIGLVLMPTALASLVAGWLGGKALDRVGSRALVVAGALVAIAAYVSLALAHDSWIELTIPAGVLGLSIGLGLTAVYPVSIRGAELDKTTIAVAITANARNTAVAVGTQVGYAVLLGAGFAGPFLSEEGFTRTFAMGAVVAGLGVLTAALLPGRDAPSAVPTTVPT
jgi:MFS family permease